MCVFLWGRRVQNRKPEHLWHSGNTKLIQLEQPVVLSSTVLTKNQKQPSGSSVFTLVKAFGRGPYRDMASVSDAYEKDFCALPLPKNDVCWWSGTVELCCCTAPKYMRLKHSKSWYMIAHCQLHQPWNYIKYNMRDFNAKADNTTACSSRNPHALFLLASLLPLLPFGSLATCLSRP